MGAVGIGDVTSIFDPTSASTRQESMQKLRTSFARMMSSNDLEARRPFPSHNGIFDPTSGVDRQASRDKLRANIKRMISSNSLGDNLTRGESTK